jgi:tyrosine-protein kinase
VSTATPNAVSEPLEHAEPGIGLRHYLAILRRRKLIVVVVFLLSLGASALYTIRQTKEYKAETTIVVGQAGGLVQPQNASAIQPFSATMQELITSTVVARNVIQSLHLNMTPQRLLGGITVSFSPESAALNVSVVESSPQLAEAVAHQIGIVFPALVNERFGTTHGGKSAATPPLTATVWDPAHVIPGKVQPRPKLNLLIAGVLGIVLGLLLAFLRDYFDRSLRSTEEIERAFGAPVIGQIPMLGDPSRQPPLTLWEQNRDYAEAFRALRANLQYLGVARPLDTLLVTSPSADQGKTTVCASLATALAHSGGSVVVVEGDLRRPRLGETFGIPGSAAGLTTHLVGKAKLSDTVAHVDIRPIDRATGRRESIGFLPSGPLPPNPSELLGSQQMRETVAELTHRYETVILDSPPMLLVADALELAKLVDGVVLVVRLKQVTWDEARELRTIAARLDIHIVGVVVVGVEARRDYTYYTYASKTDDRARVAPPAAVAKPAPSATPAASATPAGSAKPAAAVTPATAATSSDANAGEKRTFRRSAKS